VEVQLAPSGSLQVIADFCNKYLACDEEVSAYLAKRDISSDSIKQFHIGAWPKNPYVIKKHMGDHILREAKVAWNDRDNGEEIIKFQHHRLLMPMYDANNNIVAIMGRTLYDDSKQKTLKIPKYVNTGYPKRLHLFGLNAAKDVIRQTNKALVVEGNLDVIKAHQNNMLNVVACTGSSLTYEQLILLTRYTNKIYLGFDNDNAGNIATERAMIFNSKSGVTLEEKRVPKKYKDLDEYLTNRKINSIVRCIEGK
jgi:DNA primase